MGKKTCSTTFGTKISLTKILLVTKLKCEDKKHREEKEEEKEVEEAWRTKKNPPRYYGQVFLYKGKKIKSKNQKTFEFSFSITQEKHVAILLLLLLFILFLGFFSHSRPTFGVKG